LQGRQAGKKAIIIQNSDTGNKERPYGHCVVAGVQEYPKKVTKKNALEESDPTFKGEAICQGH